MFLKNVIKIKTAKTVKIQTFYGLFFVRYGIERFAFLKYNENTGGVVMSKKLVAFFSASGVTKKAAVLLANTIGADLFEIEPEVPYTKADLNWLSRKTRSTLEMKDKSSRPAIKSTCENVCEYDIVFLGFPIWWFIAPTIVNTFLESCNLSGKTVIPFATSGGSKMGKTNKFLKPSLMGAVLLEGKLLNKATKADIEQWMKELGL